MPPAVTHKLPGGCWTLQVAPTELQEGAPSMQPKQGTALAPSLSWRPLLCPESPVGLSQPQSPRQGAETAQAERLLRRCYCRK